MCENSSTEIQGGVYPKESHMELAFQLRLPLHQGEVSLGSVYPLALTTGMTYLFISPLLVHEPSSCSSCHLEQPPCVPLRHWLSTFLYLLAADILHLLIPLPLFYWPHGFSRSFPPCSCLYYLIWESVWMILFNNMYWIKWLYLIVAIWTRDWEPWIAHAYPPEMASPRDGTECMGKPAVADILWHLTIVI